MEGGKDSLLLQRLRNAYSLNLSPVIIFHQKVPDTEYRDEFPL